jgi:hypothetical protein
MVDLVNGRVDNYYTQDTTGANPQILDAGVTAYPNGWYRVWITGVSSTNDRPIINYTPTSAIVRIFSQQYIDGYQYPGSSANGIHIWGPQFEVNRYASTYTPTLDTVVIGDVINAPFRIGGNSNIPPNMANATITLAGYVNNLYSNTNTNEPTERLSTMYRILTSTIGYGLN